mgnify:FL=1
MTIPDSVIVRRVLGGDTEAFGALVAAYHERCLRLAMHLLGTREDAEDAVQESFLRAYRHLARYEERERFAAWLFRILVNQCRTAMARQRRSDARVARADELERASDVDAAESIAREDLLRRALGLLDDAQREAVLLRFGAGLSYEEMAAATGTGVSALKMRVQRGCARLRTLLGEPANA